MLYYYDHYAFDYPLLPDVCKSIIGKSKSGGHPVQVGLLFEEIKCAGKNLAGA